MRRTARRGRALATLALCGALACAPTASGDLEEASLLLVVVDALRADHLGAYGYERPTSPCFDELAARGVLFESVTSAASHTVPATLSLLTGLYPHRHGNQFFPATQSFRAPRRRVRPEVPAGVSTLAERLAAGGLRTGAVVANPWLDPRYGFDRGFESYRLRSAEPQRKRESRAPVLNREARELLERWGDERSFLYLHYMDVHNPYEPPQRFRIGLVPDAGRRVYRNGPLPEASAQDVAHTRGLYDAEVRAFDAGLCELVETLRELSRLDSTLIAVTSDHGDEFHEHGGLGHGVTLFEEVLSVPLLLVHPSLSPRRVAAPVSAVDLAPTLLALLGLPPIEAGDGLSLAGVVRGVAPAPADRLLWAELGDLKAARRGPAKRIRRRGAESPDALFDLARDPGESRPLAELEGAPAAAELQALFDTGASARPAPASPEETRLQRQLEALGYVE